MSERAAFLQDVPEARSSSATAGGGDREVSNLRATLFFARMLLAADARKVWVAAITLFTPLFVLGLFRMIGSARDMSFFFPSMVCFTVMLFGGWPAQRVSIWQRQGIFQRLSGTSVPVGYLVLGAGIVQVALSVVQTAVVLLVGVLVLHLSVSFWGALMSLPILAAGAACFVVYGALVAGVVKNPDLVNVVYMFTILPMAFLGNTILPPALMPPFVRGIQPLLPTAMLTRLVGPLINGGILPAQFPVALVGLLLYTAAFALLSLRFFRSE